jgi:hypothetical protein
MSVKTKKDTVKDVNVSIRRITNDLALNVGSNISRAYDQLYPYRSSIPGTTVDDVLTRLQAAEIAISGYVRELDAARRQIRKLA